MSQYTTPVVGLRYKAYEYLAGAVGVIEVYRDAGHIPYRVAKSIGEKKRINAGDVFVRHGSLSEKPTPAEFQALEEEGRRAKEVV